MKRGRGQGRERHETKCMRKRTDKKGQFGVLIRHRGKPAVSHAEGRQ